MGKEIPMDQLVAEIHDETGKRVIMSYQMDRAGPHTDIRR
jgi:hypothetical protein